MIVGDLVKHKRLDNLLDSSQGFGIVTRLGLQLHERNNCDTKIAEVYVFSGKFQMYLQQELEVYS